MKLFLDANAHVPIQPAALKAFVEFNSSLGGHGNAMSPSLPGQAAANAIEMSRAEIAKLIGAKPNQIIFTSTCSQACEWAVDILHNLVATTEWHAPWMSPTEHPAISQAVQKCFGLPHQLPINSDGEIINIELPVTAATICIHVQNELGVIQPLENLNSKYLLSDMSQSPGKVRFNLSNMNVSIAVFGGHKFGAPVGVGFMYLKDPFWWQSFGTGSRYFTDRAGTPDAASIVAMAAALKETLSNLDSKLEKMKAFQTTLEQGLEELGVEIIAKNAKRVPNTTFISLPKGRGNAVLRRLGDYDIHVGLGSACGSAYVGNNPLMKRLGREGGSQDYMRISTFGEYGEKEAKHFLDIFKKIY